MSDRLRAEVMEDQRDRAWENLHKLSGQLDECRDDRDRYREALEEIADPTSSAADAYAERSEWASGWRAGYRHAAEIARQALNPEESDSG